MSSTTIPCAQGVAPATLAAWRDGALGGREAGRLRAHIADCAACQAQLAAQERADAAIRAQPVPIPDERLWRGVRDGIEHPRRRVGANRSGRPMTRRAILSGIAAVAAIALITVGFARVLQARQTLMRPHGAHATATPNINVTAVPPQTQAIAGTPLRWYGGELPPTAAAYSIQAWLNYAFAVSDGNTAYACLVPAPNSQTVQIWVTHNRAATWTMTQTLQVSVYANVCTVAVDQSNAQQLTVFIANQATGPLAHGLVTRTYLSVDGGSSWRLLSATYELLSVKTAGGATYALQETYNSPATSFPSATIDLVVSRDRLQHWRVIDPPFPAGEAANMFWVAPDGRGVLAMALNDHVKGSQTLWQTADGGAHWSAVAFPHVGFDNPLIAQNPVAGQPWHICEPVYTPNPAPGVVGTTMALYCTADGGETWQARPGLVFTLACPTCGAADERNSNAVTSLVLADDGSLLGLAYGPPQNNVIGLYRLKPGATQWESLGPTPDQPSFFVYAGAPGPHVLWSYPGIQCAGTLPGPMCGNQTTQRALWTTNYV